MNSLSMPGFTAETSLYQHTTSYRMMAGSNGMVQGGGNSVSPAFWRELWGKACRAGCWAAGGLMASGCTALTSGVGAGGCIAAAGAGASICSDSC
jgi:hypothetical protein